MPELEPVSCRGQILDYFVFVALRRACSAPRSPLARYAEAEAVLLEARRELKTRGPVPSS